MAHTVTTTRVRQRADRRVALITILLLFAATAGASFYLFFFWGESLPFQTISHDQLGNWDYSPQDPTLMIIATPGEVNDVANTLSSRDPQIIEQLRRVDYSHEFVALAFYGLVGSSGYSITIQQVQRRDALVIIRADFSKPDLHVTRLAMIMSPYHFIAISKAGTWGREFRLVLMNGLRQVAQTTHFIP